MKTISIDIETFSSVELTKAGVFRYAESPDFEIMLFGYSVDGGEVKVVDFAAGEMLPPEILDALTDDNVQKWAFNANFERVCLSRHLSDRGISLDHFADNHPSSAILGKAKYLNPESWRCSMVWAAYMGLPLSLEGAGAVLGLEKQKLAEGKELVRYFCKPCAATAANDQRTRNMPEHAPDKWAAFHAYNRRDVKTEMAIQERLAKFPVPDEVWDEYVLDQEINDRGVALDMTLVRNAIAADTRSRTELMQLMKEITELDNPNSVVQMKDWLADQGLVTDTLDKKAVAGLLKSAPESIFKALTLRQQLAKSSVKKYHAMENAVCADGRARGMFQFYGANRTGRWCLTGDHEVLTQNGWQRLDEWQGGQIACWHPNGETVSFQQAEPVCFGYDGDMYVYEDKRISQISTPDHKMYVKRRYGGIWQSDTVESMAAYRPSIPFTGYRRTVSGAEHERLRVLVMVQADGHYTADGTVRLTFKKQRKIERCKMLLRRAQVDFTLREYDLSGVTAITITSRSVPIWLRLFRDKTFGSWLFDENPDVFFDEISYWDGYNSAKNSVQYTSCNRQNADMVQAFAHLSGRSALLKERNRSAQYPNWIAAYLVDIWMTPKNCHEIKAKPEILHYTGKVYCAMTPTGYFLVRRNGRVWVTGNSGRLIQMQNLPQNHMPDLEQARALVRAGDFEALELLYDSVPEVLSELIRTAFVPKPGCKFIVADFSSIEAVVLAWLAGEKWTLDAYAAKRDLYIENAEIMFGVPKGSVDKRSPLRQKSKIAVLACGFGGSVGALKAFGALEMGLKEEELKPLVTAWRASNPNIVRLWWDVDRAAKQAVRDRTTTETHGIRFVYQSGMLFITLPSGRRLCYVKPRIGVNQYGSDCVTYEGVGGTKRWERLESYGPKFVENIVQAISRDSLAFAMRAQRHCSIVMHVHDEMVVEADERMSAEVLCEQMSRTPPWAEGLLLRAEGYDCPFYKKD
jgi:hypothetical protein